MGAILLFSVGAALLLRAATPSQTGPNFVVNTLADTDDGSCDVLGQGSGNQDCSLREAINAANGYGDGATITFNVNGVITLGSSLPQISVSMTIDGTGQSVVLSGNNSVAVFTTLFAYWGYHGPVNFNGLTMAHGKGSNTGALQIYYTNVNITNCTFDSNDSTPSAGGAVRIDQGSTVAIVNSTFYNNSASYGGGVFIQGVPNGAPSAVYIYNTTFYNNHATYGTGAYNVAAADIYADSATAEIRNTVLVNTDGRAAGFGAEDNAQGLTYADRSDICNVDIDSQTFNATQATAAQINLDTLKDNGGPTATIALLTPSVALNAGNASVCNAAPVNNVDARGFSRTSSADLSCDVGAYEKNSPGVIPPLVAWRALQGLAADGSQDLAAAAGDGIANLTKYAFNMARNAGDISKPNVSLLTPTANSGLPLITSDGQGHLVVEFVRRKASSNPGVAYFVDSSADPKNWSSLDLTNASVVPLDSTWERVTVTDPTAGQKRFGRVRITSAGVYYNDFLNVGPATLNGTAIYSNHAIQLTDAGQTSAAAGLILNGIAVSPQLTGFTAKFDMAIGPTTTTTPADGVSFAVGNLPATWGEGGPGTSHSLAVGFDTYDNGGTGGIGIHLWVNGTHLAVNGTNPFTNGVSVPVEISYDATNGVTLKFNGTTIFNNVSVAPFILQSGDQFGFGARTGGAAERAVIDDVQISPH